MIGVHFHTANFYEYDRCVIIFSIKYIWLWITVHQCQKVDYAAAKTSTQKHDVSDMLNNDDYSKYQHLRIVVW